MKNLKFKYYCEETKKMLPVYSIRFDDEQFSMIHILVGDCFHAVPITKVNKDNLVQWTGLKDAKNNDVYEGDIVGHNGFYCAVKLGEYEDSECYCDEYHYGWYLDKGEKYDSTSTLADAHKEMIVVGNVFENIELLKK